MQGTGLTEPNHGDDGSKTFSGNKKMNARIFKLCRIQLALPNRLISRELNV